MDQIEAALADLRLNPSQTYQDVATRYKVNRTRLSKRHRGITKSQEEGYDSQCLLSDGQSAALLNQIRNLTAKGLPPTHDILRNFAP